MRILMWEWRRPVERGEMVKEYQRGRIGTQRCDCRAARHPSRSLANPRQLRAQSAHGSSRRVGCHEGRRSAWRQQRCGKILANRHPDQPRRCQATAGVRALGRVGRYPDQVGFEVGCDNCQMRAPPQDCGLSGGAARWSEMTRNPTWSSRRCTASAPQPGGSARPVTRSTYLNTVPTSQKR